MRSWKTTLGGALAALGTFLWGAPVAMDAMKVAMDPAVTKWCVIAGLIASGGGVFFMGLFGRDNNVTSEMANAGKAENQHPTSNIQHPTSNLRNVPAWVMAAVVSGMVLTGCATKWIDKVAQTRVATTQLVHSTVTEFNAYYRAKTNAMNGATADLIAAKSLVYEASTKFGNTAYTLELLENGYKQNTVTSNEVVKVFITLGSNATNVVEAVKYVTKGTP